MSAPEQPAAPSGPAPASVSVDTQRHAARIIETGKAPMALRYAADKVRRHAEQHQAIALPWFARPEDSDDPDPDEWQIGVQPTPPYPGASFLMGGGYVADELPERVARWASLLGPQVAGALCALLDGVATALDAGAASTDPGTTPDYVRHAVELAVEILHEEPIDDDL